MRWLGNELLSRLIPRLDMRTRFMERQAGFLSFVSRVPRVGRVIDTLILEHPPVRLQRIAAKVGIPASKVSYYVSRLKRMGITFRVNFSTSAIGLGTLVVKVRDVVPEVSKVPEKHWLTSISDCVGGFIATYRYPLTLGYQFIVEGLKRVYDGRIEYAIPFEEAITPLLQITPYVKGCSMLNPIEAFAKALEQEALVETSWSVNRGPNDIFDLFILAVLEVNALLKYTEIARILNEKLNVTYPRRRVRQHVRHLEKLGVFRGLTPLAIHGNTNILGLSLRAGSSRGLREAVTHLLKYPYSAIVLCRDRWDEALAIFRMDLAYAPAVRALVNEVLGAETSVRFVTDVTGIRARYTIPYRNFDPISKKWVRNPARLNEWLREHGYTTEGISRA